MAAMRSFDLCCCYRCEGCLFPNFCMRDMDLRDKAGRDGGRVVRKDNIVTLGLMKTTKFYEFFINLSFGGYDAKLYGIFFVFMHTLGKFRQRQNVDVLVSSRALD